MALLANSYLDIADLCKRTDGRGRFADIIEVLMQENDIVRHAPAFECNNGTSHEHAIRTGLPSVAWGELYKGTPQSKSESQKVEDVTGFLEASSYVDKRLYDLAGPNGNALRLSEAKPFMEAMNQELATGIFYNDQASNPNRFTGLAARYNTLGGGGAGNQIIDAGGTGTDNTSFWFVTWGQHTTGLLYPEGTVAGINHEDKGEQRVLDDQGNPYYVLEDMWRAHIGLYVKDWRFNARVANIDVSNMVADPTNIDGSNNSIFHYLRKAAYKLQQRRKITGAGARGGTVCYCNRDVLEALEGVAFNTGANDSFVRLQWREVEGQEVLTYRGMPIYETDAIVNNEARVV